ncbi:SLATT domain-containing protein [Longimicrobium sp.]|uniref:SLATT domain-containing protein n=1 Tax=Longimicrobium sp. TaxID=2029185 RepID=UPI003B3B255E
MSAEKLTPQQKQFLEFYETYRRGAQSKWYRNRFETYERAHRQSVTLTTLVLFLSSAASILSVAWERPTIWPGVTLYWPVIAAVLTAAGTAIAAYRSLYGFQENSRLYRDADNSLAAVLADSPVECENCPEAAIRTIGDYIPRVEEVFRREQGQWGQLVAQIRAVTVPGAEKEGGGDDALGGGPVGGGGGGGGGGGNGGGGGAPVKPVTDVVLEDTVVDPAGEGTETSVTEITVVSTGEVDADITVVPPVEPGTPEKEDPDPPSPAAPGEAVG